MIRPIFLVLMLGPVVLIIVVLFLGSILFAAGQSLGYMPIIGKHNLTLAHYSQIFASREFIVSTALTFHIAFASTVVSAAIAVACALALARVGSIRLGVAGRTEGHQPVEVEVRVGALDDVVDSAPAPAP